MVRMRIPGGVLDKHQWWGIAELFPGRYAETGASASPPGKPYSCTVCANPHLRALMQGSAGDIGLGHHRPPAVTTAGGVVCGTNPFLSRAHHRVCGTGPRHQRQADSQKTGALPRKSGYRESRSRHAQRKSPVYGELYLPRKFKVGYAIPPVNDIDVYGQDLGLIAVIDNGELRGFNVCVGGGMGSAGQPARDSYPRLAEEIGFIDAEEAPAFSETVMTIQRDFGDRKDRHRAPFQIHPWIVSAWTGSSTNWRTAGDATLSRHGPRRF
jgi:sulfite reductase (NADPH) hemoprotein beta-component